MPLMQLKMLVLPAPLGPMMAKKSPALTASLTPAKAATPPKLRCNPSKVSNAIPTGPPGPAMAPTRAGAALRRAFGHASMPDATLNAASLSIGDQRRRDRARVAPGGATPITRDLRPTGLRQDGRVAAWPPCGAPLLLHRDGLQRPAGAKLDFLGRARAAGYCLFLVFVGLDSRRSPWPA